jgi:hypothetical protein
MKIRVITSCTGEKRHSPSDALTQDDFRELGTPVFAGKETQFGQQCCPAEQMYTGMQHQRLMRGVSAWRAARPSETLDLRVLSAGYGLIRGDRIIAPYECTFSTMRGKDLAAWAVHLQVPRDIRAVLAEPADLCLLLLGDKYQEACQWDAQMRLGAPTLLFCGQASAGKLPRLSHLHRIVVGNADTKRFSCGLVGLKGELGARVVEGLAKDPSLMARLIDPTTDVLGCLAGDAPAARRGRGADGATERTANPSIDRVVDIPGSWWEESKKRKIRYFIPEWDDLVDPAYNFIADEHSGGRGEWGNQVYAHQMYRSGPNYDGILVSRVVAEKGRRKAAAINKVGVHRYLRVPDAFPILGDCGAFDYIAEKAPPFSTTDVIDYYTRLGFNYGVSVDHLIVPAFADQNKYRYDLTIQNAEDFLKEHRKRGLRWTPIGAVQGWDPASYAKAAKKYIGMGYTYLALGGLVRSPTSEVVRILQAVQEVVPAGTDIHLFGLGRLNATREFARLGATSMDSTSALRTAWLGSTKNYLTTSGWYSAVRVPQTDGSFRAKRLVDEGGIGPRKLANLERACLDGLRAYDKTSRGAAPQSLIDNLVEYDTLVAGTRSSTEGRIRRVLDERPWQHCGCDICKTWGIEVVIFRGNNRNRRRGFHNTHVFYHMIKRIFEGERFPWLKEDDEDAGQQQSFLNSAVEAVP